MTRRLGVGAFVLIVHILYASPAAPANNLQLKLTLPQNTPQFFYDFMGGWGGVAVDSQGNVYMRMWPITASRSSTPTAFT
jgi:hypothetical protein